MKRGGNLTRRTRLQQVGRRGRRDRADRAVTLEVLLARSGGGCEARCSELCTGEGAHQHHLLRRSQGGTNTADNLLWVCWWCHRHIHDNPAESFVAGFLIPSWEGR